MDQRAVAAYLNNVKRRRRRLSGQSLDDQLIAIIGDGAGAYYRVSDLDTLFVERTGAAATTPAEVDGPVGTILNKSAFGVHLVAVSDASRGTLRFSGGVYYIENDGVNTAYTSTPVGGLTSVAWQHYIAMSARRRSAAALNFRRGVSSSHYVRLMLDSTNSRGAFVTRNNGVVSTLNGATNSVPVDTWATVDGFCNVGTNKLGINGAAQTTAVNGNEATTAAGGLSIFTSTTGTPDSVQGDWAGGFYLNREPTADERATINTLLTSLYDTMVLSDLGLVVE